MNSCRITPCGPIQGTSSQWPGIEAYKGIRYANAQRWRYAEPVSHWTGVYDATKYGACCFQPRSFCNEAEMPEKAFYYHEFREGEQYSYSEDCLFLNIWTPESADSASRLPVIFYIHGGGFTGGCGHEKHFDGPVWPTRGCVAVTINYRLGPLGFACMKELKNESGITGNYALFDQLEALRWVKRNITSFGGDPDNITIMGQSAGAMSVQQFCLSPLTERLFSKAVMSSGGGVNQQFTATPAENHYIFWNEVKDEMHCSSVQEMREAEPAELFQAWKIVSAKHPAQSGIGPVIDGKFLQKPGMETVNANLQHHIPYMLGSNSEDMMTPFIFTMAKEWASLNPNPESYLWFFERQLPGDSNGAWHSADLWYWFGTLDHCWREFTKDDFEISSQMVGYLTNFAKTGNPNNDGLPQWSPYSQGGTALKIGGSENLKMGLPDMEQLMWTMKNKKPVGE